MVAIVAGNGVGLSNSSLALLGQGGALGDAQQGRALDRVYVNAATGNLTIQHAEEGLAGLGPDISVARTYNSLGQLVDDNADNWQPGLNKKVYGLTGTLNTAGSTVTRRDSDGTEIVYTYNTGLAAYVATDGDGAHDTLSLSASTWTWTDGSSRATETYDNANGGRITTRKDADLNTLTYTYNGGGLLTQVASANGESVYLDYTGTKITQIRTVTNGGTTTVTRVRYGYDASNRLSTVTVDLSPADNSIADAKTYVTTYTYDGTSTRVASITQSDGTRVDFAYTLVGSDYRLTQVTQDPLGLNRVTGISYNTGTRTTTITHPLGQTTVVVYDTANRLLTVTGPAVGGVSQTVSYAYDASGNVSSMTDARGNVTVYQYDANGNRTLERDAAGNTVTRTFSAANQVLTQTVYAVADPDGAGAGQPGTPSTTRYAYDAENHLRFVVSGEGAVSETRYNAAGQTTQSIGYVGSVYNVTALLPTDTLSETTLATWTQNQDKTDTTLLGYTYDARGQLASTTRYARVNASGQGVSDGTQATTNYVYDSAGNLLSSVDPRGVATTGVPNDYVTTYTYDGLNRLTASTDALGAVTLLQYDDANRKTVTTAANGLITTSTYDKSGALISVVKSDATPTTYGETKYFYDANQQLRMAQDPTGIKSHSLYDAAGRKVADVDATGSLIEYIYNPNNQVVSTIRYATAANLGLLVDVSGNPTSVALSSVRPTANASDRRTWVIYDSTGRVAKTIDETGAVTERLYDGRSRLTKTIAYATLVNPALITTSTLATDTAVSPTGSSNDRITRYFYDNDDNKRGVLDAEGYLTEYRYDALGRLSETIGYATATTVGLRATGSLAALIPTGAAGDIRTSRLYDASGQLIGEVDPEGYLTEHIYDLAGNRTQSIRYATQVNSLYLTSRSVPLVVTAKTSAGAISMQVMVDGVAVPGSPVSVTTTSYATYSFNVSLVSGQNHAVDVVFTDAGPDLSIQSVSLDGQTVASTDAATTFDAGTGTAAFDGSGVIAGQALLNQSGALRFAVYGLPRLRPTSVVADQSSIATYDALNRVLTQTAPDGTVSQFTYDNVGNLLTKSNAFGTAEVRTLTHKFDRLGRVTAELSGQGTALLAGLVNQVDIDAVWAAYSLKHTYDAAGRRTSTTDEVGNKTLFYYNGDGQLTHTINALGEVIETAYNTLDQVSSTVKYTVRLSAGTLAGLQGGVADSSFLSVIAGLSNVSIDTRRQVQYDLAGRVSLATDALGHTVSYAYDAFGGETSRVTQINATQTLTQTTGYDRRGLATQSAADPAGINVVNSMQYDAFGRVTQSTDGNGNNTYQNFDRLGRVVQVRDAFNKAENTTYDAFNRVLTRTDRLGNVTTFVYNTANRSVQVTTQEGVGTTTVRNRNGEVASQTDGKGGITSFSYDADGNLIATTTPLSGSSKRYDAAGRVIETTDANGVKTAYTYDAAGRLTSRIVDPFDAGTNPAGLNLVTNYRYDGQGRSIWVQDPKGVWTQTDYDKEGQVTAVTIDPKRSPNWVGGGDDNPNGLAIQTTYAYDYRGKTLTVTEGAGSTQPRVTQYTYDALGRRTQEAVDPSGATPLNLVTSYAYDKNNNVSTKTDAAGGVTRYYYDAEDRLIYTLDPLNGLIQRIYDDAGRLIQTIAYANALTGLPGQPTVANIQSALVVNATSDQALRSIYDRDGREVYTIDALGYVSKKTFDPNGNVVAQTRYATAVSLSGNPTLTQVGNALVPNATLDRTTKSVYDAENRLRYSVDALGYVTETKYDNAGNITQTILRAVAPSLSASPTLAELDALYGAAALGANDRQQRFEYDAAGRLSRSFDGEGYFEQYGYDAVGNRISFTNKNGSVWTYTYDANRRLISEFSPQVEVTTVAPVSGQLTAATTTASLETRITYNVLGSVISRTEAYGRPEARTTSYEYDKAGRQIKTTFPSVGVYNAAGDNLTTNGINGTVTRAETGQTPVNEVTLDALGRAVVNKDVAGNYGYKVYDALGRIAYEIDAEKYVTKYTYDAFANKLTTTRYSTALGNASGFYSVAVYGIHTPGAVFTAAEVAARIVANGTDRVITSTYDRLNRATQIVEPAAFTYDSTTGSTASVGRTTVNLYNRYGEVIKQTIANASTYFYFDRRGSKTAQIDALGNLSAFEYNANRELTRQVEYAKALTAGSWNETNLPSPTTSTPIAPDTPVPLEGFDRDVTYQYDRKGQKVAETRVNARYQTLGSGLTVNETSGNLTTTYGYDGVGNLTRTTDTTGASRYTYYDALGRTIATADPSRQVNSSGGAVVMPPVRSSSHWIGSKIAATELLTTNGETSSWTGTNSVNIGWESLADYGDGNVRVVINYTGSVGGAGSVDQWFGSASAMAGTTVSWNGSGSVRGIASISQVRVWKIIDGAQVLVYDTSAGLSNQRITFQKPTLPGINVALQYKAQGAASWTTATLTSEGNLFTVLVNSLPADLYQYQLTYTKASDGSTVATGTGTFMVQTGNASGSLHATNFVEKASLTIAAASGTWQPATESTAAQWIGNNSINLSWPALENWQGGTMRVIVDYRTKNAAGAVGGTAQQIIDVDPALAKTGASFVWNGGTNSTSGGLYAVDRVRVLRWVGTTANATTIIDRTASGTDASERLILEGNTTGLTGINIAGVGVRSATALGAGVFAVDLSGLARGTYQYTVVGNGSAGGAFQVKKSTTAGSPVIQEMPVGTDWQLNAYNLPSDTTSAIFQYRRSGDTGPYLSKGLTKQLSTNEWTASYDDLVSGGYDYQIVASRPGGPSTYTGTLAIARGASPTTTTQTQSVAQTLTPLTIAKMDAFGETVQQIRLARGASSATADGFALAGADAADQVSYIQRDAHGHAIWSQDAEGKASYASYDILGNSAKEWRPITDNDGRVQNAIRVFKYDKLGQLVETLEPSFRPNAALVTSPTPQALSDAQLNFGIASSATWVLNESTWSLSGTSSVSLGWNDMSAWGADDVQVVVNYTKTINPVRNESGTTTYTNAAATKTFVLASGSAATGATVSWTDTTIIGITSVQVYKRDSSGTFRLIHDRSSSSASPYSKVLTFSRPNNQDTVQVKYRTVGAPTWTTAGTPPFVTFGSKFLFDLRALAAGPYEYEVLYTRAGESSPYARYGATMTVAAGTGSILTPGSAASSYTVPSLNPANYLRSQASYNAFGEVTAKLKNDAVQETFEYDNAGRLWRTNQGDGVYKVSLYDVVGNATAAISGLTTGLNTVADANAAYQLATAGGANPPTAVSWTRTKYDALGRAVSQIQPSFVVAGTNLIPVRGSENVALTFGIASSGTWTSTESGWVINGTSSVNVSWTDFGAWGTGDVQVILDYTKTINPVSTESGVQTTPAAASKTFNFSGATTTASAVLSWNDTTITGISRVRVYKKDMYGNFQLVHDRNTSSASPYRGLMTWTSPAVLSTQMTMQVRPTGTTPYASRTLVNFGSKVVMDTTTIMVPTDPTLSATTYDYLLTYVMPGNTGTSTDTGTFTAGGTTTNVTNAPVTNSNTTFTPTVTQTFDRWGNVLSVSDPRDGTWVTYQRYNGLSQRIRTILPAVKVGAADTTDSTYSPETYVHYDALGRQIATKDANNNINTSTLDAAGQVVTETHADGAQVNYVYDAFGRKASVKDALNNVTNYTYDRMGRLTGEAFPIGSRAYVYDEVGNRIQETDATSNTTKYWYDTRGKVIQTRLAMGQESAAFYDDRGNQVKSIDANGNVATWSYDYFGRVTAHTDMGGKTYTYSYDNAVTKRLLSQTDGWGAALTYAYYEDGKLKSITDTSTATPATTLYEYDQAGHRTRERYSRGTTTPTVYQDARIGFDALGRIWQIVDVKDTITYTYDAVGNRRHTVSTFYDTNNVQRTVDNWYLYDAMNRITLSQGVPVWNAQAVKYEIKIRPYQAGTPPTPAQGIELAYDGAGNRRTATFYEGTSGTAVTETYTYDTNNQLLTTNRGGSLTSSRTYDAAGRVTQTISYSSPNVMSLRRQNTYNANGWLTQTDSYNASNTLQSRVSYTAFDNVGNTKTYSVAVYTGTAYTNYYNYTYELRDSYKEKVIAGTSTYFSPGNTTTTFDANGYITQVTDLFATNKTRTFINDQQGHILQKTENGQTQNFFYANGNPVGSSGIVNSGGTLLVNPDFDYNYTPVNDRYPPVTPGSYSVVQGDTLQGIALNLFGDASLWYIIADANGLRQDSDLIVGKTLTIPNKITNLRNSYDVHKPYQPGEIIGDTTPTLPDPPPPPVDSGGGCGAVGMILIAAVAVVATVFTAGAAALAMPSLATATAGMTTWAAGTAALGGALGAGAGLAAAVIGGAVGSIVSQGVGIAMGMQDKFSWSGVAMGAIGAGLTAGLGASGGALAKFAGEGIPQSMLAGAARNVVTQGLGIITGTQDQFDWKSLAVSAISAPIVSRVSDGVGKALSANGESIAKFGSSLAGNLAAGAVRQLVYGGKGDFASVAADAFGNALGDAFVEAQVGKWKSQQAAELRKAQEKAAGPRGIDLGGAAMAAVKGGDPSAEARDGAGQRGINLGAAGAGFTTEGRSDVPYRGAHAFRDLGNGTFSDVLPTDSDEPGSPYLLKVASQVERAPVANSARLQLSRQSPEEMFSNIVDERLGIGSSWRETIDVPGDYSSRLGPRPDQAFKEGVEFGFWNKVVGPLEKFGAMVTDIFSGKFGTPESRYRLADRRLSAQETVFNYRWHNAPLSDLLSGSAVQRSSALNSAFAYGGEFVGETLPLVVAPEVGVMALRSGVGLRLAATAESGVGRIATNSAERTLVQRVTPNVRTGEGYSVNNPPVRIEGEWSRKDFFDALMGRSPKGLGKPDLHHADQMPGSAIHEVLPAEHRGNTALHPNKFNQGVTPQMRQQDKQLHWWYRAREHGADQKFPDWIYDN